MEIAEISKTSLLYVYIIAKKQLELISTGYYMYHESTKTRGNEIIHGRIQWYIH